MNDYISLCGGDPCPPIFRSPIAGLEDIMDNQIICDIYRLPDAHKHITQPPVGVIFPKKIVSVGDLKPEPVLWHEDNGRKPWENGRQNLPGTISGRQLGEAAHRLVVNSLQLKVERNGFGDQMHAPPPCPAATYGPPLSSYSDDRYHTQEHHWMVLPRQDYSDQTLRRTSYPTSVRNHFDHIYDQPYASSATGHHYNRSHQHERNNRSAVNSDPVHGYYQSGFHQNGGPGYHPRQVAQTHISTSAHLPGQGGYNSYISY